MKSHVIALVCLMISGCGAWSPFGPSCSAKQVSFSVASCCPITAWYWNGTACVESNCGCACSGDCGDTYSTRAACEADYRSCR
ncbi:MAG: hypothetical protein RIT81_02760 [Deltaproteobacteria bacterium]